MEVHSSQALLVGYGRDKEVKIKYVPSTVLIVVTILRLEFIGTEVKQSIDNPLVRGSALIEVRSIGGRDTSRVPGRATHEQGLCITLYYGDFKVEFAGSCKV